MSIVRLYRETVGDDGARLFEYREAWADAEAGEFVVHHGRVGQPGTVGEQPLADPAEGDQLLAAFVAQGAEEGFAEADPRPSPCCRWPTGSAAGRPPRSSGAPSSGCASR